MASAPAWRVWLLASALLAVAVPAAAVRAEEAPTDGGNAAAPGVACVTRALRVGAAEVNGLTRGCVDTATNAVTTTSITFSSPAADATPVSYMPLPGDQGSDVNTLTSDPQP